jgi:hypothetical protein
MGRTCFIPNCRTGYKSRKGEIITQKYTVFSVPKDEILFNMWKKSIPRSDRPLDNKSYVCERHFLPHEILDCFEKCEGVLKRCVKKLLTGAIPSQWPGNVFIFVKVLIDTLKLID